MSLHEDNKVQNISSAFQNGMTNDQQLLPEISSESSLSFSMQVQNQSQQQELGQNYKKNLQDTNKGPQNKIFKRLGSYQNLIRQKSLHNEVGRVRYSDNKQKVEIIEPNFSSSPEKSNKKNFQQFTATHSKSLDFLQMINQTTSENEQQVQEKIFYNDLKYDLDENQPEPIESMNHDSDAFYSSYRKLQHIKQELENKIVGNHIIFMSSPNIRNDYLKSMEERSNHLLNSNSRLQDETSYMRGNSISDYPNWLTRNYSSQEDLHKTAKTYYKNGYRQEKSGPAQKSEEVAINNRREAPSKNGNPFKIPLDSVKQQEQSEIMEVSPQSKNKDQEVGRKGDVPGPDDILGTQSEIIQGYRDDSQGSNGQSQWMELSFRATFRNQNLGHDPKYNNDGKDFGKFKGKSQSYVDLEYEHAIHSRTAPVLDLTYSQEFQKERLQATENQTPKVDEGPVYEEKASSKQGQPSLQKQESKNTLGEDTIKAEEAGDQQGEAVPQRELEVVLPGEVASSETEDLGNFAEFEAAQKMESQPTSNRYVEPQDYENGLTDQELKEYSNDQILKPPTMDFSQLNNTNSHSNEREELNPEIIPQGETESKSKSIEFQTIDGDKRDNDVALHKQAKKSHGHKLDNSRDSQEQLEGYNASDEGTDEPNLQTHMIKDPIQFLMEESGQNDEGKNQSGKAYGIKIVVEKMDVHEPNLQGLESNYSLDDDLKDNLESFHEADPRQNGNRNVSRFFIFQNFHEMARFKEIIAEKLVLEQNSTKTKSQNSRKKITIKRISAQKEPRRNFKVYTFGYNDQEEFTKGLEFINKLESQYFKRQYVPEQAAMKSIQQLNSMETNIKNQSNPQIEEEQPNPAPQKLFRDATVQNHSVYFVSGRNQYSGDYVQTPDRFAPDIDTKRTTEPKISGNWVCMKQQSFENTGQKQRNEDSSALPDTNVGQSKNSTDEAQGKKQGKTWVVPDLADYGWDQNTDPSMKSIQLDSQQEIEIPKAIIVSQESQYQFVPQDPQITKSQTKIRFKKSSSTSQLLKFSDLQELNQNSRQINSNPNMNLKEYSKFQEQYQSNNLSRDKSWSQVRSHWQPQLYQFPEEQHQNQYGIHNQIVYHNNQPCLLIPATSQFNPQQPRPYFGGNQGAKGQNLMIPLFSLQTQPYGVPPQSYQRQHQNMEQYLQEVSQSTNQHTSRSTQTSRIEQRGDHPGYGHQNGAQFGKQRDYDRTIPNTTPLNPMALVQDESQNNLALSSSRLGPQTCKITNSRALGNFSKSLFSRKGNKNKSIATEPRQTREIYSKLFSKGPQALDTKEQVRIKRQNPRFNNIFTKLFNGFRKKDQQRSDYHPLREDFLTDSDNNVDSHQGNQIIQKQKVDHSTQKTLSWDLNGQNVHNIKDKQPVKILQLYNSLGPPTHVRALQEDSRGQQPDSKNKQSQKFRSQSFSQINANHPSNMGFQKSAGSHGYAQFQASNKYPLQSYGSEKSNQRKFRYNKTDSNDNLQNFENEYDNDRNISNDQKIKCSKLMLQCFNESDTNHSYSASDGLGRSYQSHSNNCREDQGYDADSVIEFLKSTTQNNFQGINTI